MHILEVIYTYCITLDPKADDYVTDIFGRQYSVIDRVERLPEKLPELFLSLSEDGLGRAGNESVPPDIPGRPPAAESCPRQPPSERPGRGPKGSLGFLLGGAETHEGPG